MRRARSSDGVTPRRRRRAPPRRRAGQFLGLVRPRRAAEGDDARADEQDERGDRDDVHGDAAVARGLRGVQERVRVPPDERAADHRVDRPRDREDRDGPEAAPLDVPAPGGEHPVDDEVERRPHVQDLVRPRHGRGLVERDLAQQQVVDHERGGHVRDDARANEVVPVGVAASREREPRADEQHDRRHRVREDREEAEEVHEEGRPIGHHRPALRELADDRDDDGRRRKHPQHSEQLPHRNPRPRRIRPFRDAQCAA